MARARLMRKKTKARSDYNHKYIFVVGGVMSGVGKGVATSSIGTLLEGRGFAVNLVKVDPYLNVDAGTMNPTEHGEVFVLDSGLETDQDMGNYERFLNRDASEEDYMTSGMVYKAVIDRERRLGYGGKCVEAVPHIRDEIVGRFEHAAKASRSDVSIIEIGGTVGDYQNIMFIEAARVLKIRHPDDVAFIMVSYLPVPSKLGEMKTRPTQHAVHQLASYGVNADLIIARAEMPLDKRRKEKIAAACNISPERVVSAPDIDSIYDVPVNFEHDRLGDTILGALHLEKRKPGRNGAVDFSAWKRMAREIKDHEDRPARIAIVGKYFATGDFVLTDSYLSVLEAIKFSARAAGVKAVIEAVNAGDFEGAKPDFSKLDGFDGIIVPGGFGSTGIEGKLAVIRHAREKKIPYLGLCYGMQLLTVEYARHRLGLAGANTTEIDPKAKDPVIDILPEQRKKLEDKDYGGSMRLGLYPAKLMPGTVAHDAYAKALNKEAKSKKQKGSRRPLTIHERHRHRFEVNPAYVARLEKAGLLFSGKSPDGTLCEIAELPRSQHPFFLGAQFHPEFLARPLRPHPLFTGFMKAAGERAGK